MYVSMYDITRLVLFRVIRLVIRDFFLRLTRKLSIAHLLKWKFATDSFRSWVDN